MAELDTLLVHNILDEEIEVGYNGEKYKMIAGEEKSWPQHLARKIAKEISDRVCTRIANEKAEAIKKKKDPVPQTLKQQIGMLDNPHRRIALYKILKSKEEVERTIKAFPQFKADDNRINFVGEIEEYDTFVENFNKETTPEPLPEKKEPKKEEAPKKRATKEEGSKKEEVTE